MQLPPASTQAQLSSPGRLPEPALLDPPLLEPAPDEVPPWLVPPDAVPPPLSGSPPDAVSPPALVPPLLLEVPPLWLALPASLLPSPALFDEVPPLPEPEADEPPFAGSSLESELHAAAPANSPVRALAASRRPRCRNVEEACSGWNDMSV